MSWKAAEAVQGCLILNLKQEHTFYFMNSNFKIWFNKAFGTAVNSKKQKLQYMAPLAHVNLQQSNFVTVPK